MKAFIERIVKNLVDKPDDVKVVEIAGEKTVVYELSVGEGDIGKVIGKHGQTALAIRTLVSAASAKIGKRSVIEILD